MVLVVNFTPRPLYSGEWPRTHCTEGWLDSRTGLGRCGKSHRHRHSIPGPSSPWRVPIPTALSQTIKFLVGLLWTSDQSVVETSTWQHATLTTDKHPCSRWDFSRRAAVDLRLRPRGHWDRHKILGKSPKTDSDPQYMQKRVTRVYKIWNAAFRNYV
jgi:hypothetical protein